MCKRALFLMLFSALLSIPRLASAQFVVSDPTNLVENAVTAASTASSVLKQIQQVRNQIKMYQAMLKNLKSLSFRDLDQMVISMTKIQRILYATRAIGYRYQAVERQFDALYGKYGPKSYQGAQFSAKRKAWNKQTDDALLDAMRTGGLVAGQNASLAQGFARLENASRSAEGTKQALQVTNEMLSVMVKQNKLLSEMILTDSRAKHSQMMQARRGRQAATLRSRRALGAGMGERRVKDKPVVLKDF